MYNSILIIDGSYYLNRVMSVPRLFDMTNDAGIYNGGVFGFLRSFISDIEKFPNYFPVVVFDSGISEKRLALYAEYKRANEREITDEIPLDEMARTDNFGIRYKFQRSMLVDILTNLGVPVIMSEGYEGDDIIYLISTMCNHSVIATEDRDMWQLVRDNCVIYMPVKKHRVDTGFLHTLYESTDEFIVSKAVLGDSSDNIPSSCFGIGDKSIKAFLDLLQLFRLNLIDREWDFSNFPNTELELRELCNKSGIPYKRAYLNFNPEQFLINIELVDLFRVEDNPIIHTVIDRAIQDCRTNLSVNTATSKLLQLQIDDIDIDKIVCDVSKSYFHLYNRNTLF